LKASIESIVRAGALGAELHHRLVDQLVEDAALVLRALESRGVERLALTRPLLLADLVEPLAEFIDRNLDRLLAEPEELARRHHFGGVILHLRRQVLLEAEQRHHQDDQEKDQLGDPAGGFVADFLQHGAAAPEKTEGAS